MRNDNVCEKVLRVNIDLGRTCAETRYLRKGNSEVEFELCWSKQIRIDGNAKMFGLLVENVVKDCQGNLQIWVSCSS